MSDIPAIACDVEACSATVAGERKAVCSKSHHSEQQKRSESFHTCPFHNPGISMICNGPSYSIVQGGNIAIESP
jgi:hypothetical protein